jgi:hypothetical protein
MRRLLIGLVLAGVTALPVAACGGSGMSAGDAQALREQADRLQIDQIEAKFHQALSTKNVDLMMSLWAPHATFTVGAGRTLTGKAQIRAFWLRDAPGFQPENHWIWSTSPYKIRITINGSRGALFFECYAFDTRTREVKAATAADMQVAKTSGKWLITNNAGANISTLTP